jgi:hypothetical protein
MPTYIEELAEWVKNRESSKRKQDKNLVAFLAIQEDIRAAIDAGYPLRTIWEHLHQAGKITYRYETFLRHVQRRIREKQPRPAKTEKPQPIEAATSVSPQPMPVPNNQPPAPAKSTMSGFTFNPIPDPEKLF